MSDNPLSAPYFFPGERVYHPRLGLGTVLQLRADGTLLIQFAGCVKCDILFPLQLEHLENLDRLPPPPLSNSQRFHLNNNFIGKDA
jgi:hypothetical protein